MSDRKDKNSTEFRDNARFIYKEMLFCHKPSLLNNVALAPTGIHKLWIVINMITRQNCVTKHNLLESTSFVYIRK